MVNFIQKKQSFNLANIKISFSCFFCLKNMKKRFTFLQGTLINRVPCCKKAGSVYFYRNTLF